MTVMRLATGLNDMVQWDILFIDDFMVSHLVDEATRWSAGSIIAEKTATAIIKAITSDWFRPLGPMKLLATDQEPALMSEECSQWLDRWSVQLKTKEPGSHAQIVARHHELFRQIYHRTKAQLKEEKIVLDKEVFVAECFLVKNLMISVAGSSPYQAVYGRVPPLMAEFEPASETQLDDTSGGVSGMSRHHHRLREVSVQIDGRDDGETTYGSSVNLEV